MSDFSQALLISGSIFAVTMLSSYGHREYSTRKVVVPVLAVLGFGYAYLGDLSTAGNAIWLYAVGIVIGGVFAVLSTLATGVERVGRKVYTTTGLAFVVTWFVAMAVRVGFVWSVEHLDGFRNHVGIFMYDHQLVEATIAPFFVLMALTTVVGRVVAVQIRARRLVRADAPLLTVAAVGS